MQRITMFSLALALTVSGAAPLIECAQAGKPGGGGEPTLPPVRYQIQFWDVPNPPGGGQVNGMNNLGQAVGYYYLPDGARHAFLYDPAVDPDTAIDLHDVISLLGGGTLFPGWVAASGIDINDFGMIVGYLVPAGDPWNPDFRKGFVLDTANWTLSPLPDDDWNYSYPNAINENGDIAGQYRRPDGTWDAYFTPADGGATLLLGQSVQNTRIYLNNPSGTRSAQVAGQLSNGTPFRWTIGAGVEIISGINSPSVEGFNDSGTICGSTYTKVGKGSSARYPYRYNTALQILSGGKGYGKSINSAGDLLNPLVGGGAHLYHDTWGFLNPDDLIDATDTDSTTWFARRQFSLTHLTDRDDTTFGAICGQLTEMDLSSSFFLLTPVPVPTP